MTSRSLRSITFRYEDCISSRLLVAQEPPRNTPQSRLLPFVPPLYVSRHHSQTFPPRSFKPNEFGLKLPTGIVAPPSVCCGIISRTVGWRPLFSPREFILNLAVTHLRRRTAFINKAHRHAPLKISRKPVRLPIFNQI